MDIVSEVNNTLKLEQRHLKLFSILILYDQNPLDLACFNDLKIIIDRLNQNVLLFNEDKTSDLQNILENDLATFKGFIDEIITYAYPLFSAYSICLLDNLKINELEQIYEHLKDNNHKFDLKQVYEKIKSFLNLSGDLRLSSKIIDLIETKFDETSFSSAINLLRQKRRDMQSIVLDEAYLEVISEFFDYLNKGIAYE